MPVFTCRDGETVTESEFQEFMITVGYRYSQKAKAAFHSFDGFRTIICFNEKDHRYHLTLKAGTSVPSELQEQLKRYSTAHKNSVTSAGYARQCVKITLKMTIDSDIDKEELKQLAHFMVQLLKGGKLKPLCGVCSRERKTGLYVVGTELVPICDSCLVRKRRQYEIRKNKFIKKKQNMSCGLLGAVFGAVFGASVYILLYQFMPTFGTGGLLIILLSFIGFVVTGKRATVQSALLCAALSAVVFLLAEYAAMVANMAVLIEQAGGGIAVSEAMEVINASFGDFSYVRPVLTDTVIGFVLMLAAGAVYFLKRKLTRPLKISDNIL